MDVRRLGVVLALSFALSGVNQSGKCDEVGMSGSLFGKPYYNTNSVKELNDQIQNEPDSKKYKLRAEKLRKLGLRKDAVDDLNKALELAPGDARAYLLRGESFADEGMYDEAIGDFTTAIKSDPQLFEAYAARAAAHIKIKAFDKAVQDASTVLKLEENFPLGFALRAAAYDGMKNYAKAVDDASTCIKLNPKIPKAFYYRALAYQGLGSFDKAVADYSSAIDLEPGYRSAYLGRAWSNYSLGKLDDAVDDCSKAIRFDESTQMVLDKFLGEKATEATITPDADYIAGAQIDEDLKNALILFDDVLKKDPNNKEAHRDRGLVYMHLAKFDEGIKDFEAANAGANANADFPGFGSQKDYLAAKVDYDAGNAILAKGDYALAAANYQSALQKYPQYAKCWHNLAIATGYLNQFSNAELYAIKSVSYNPDDWKLWQTLGWELYAEYQHDKSDPKKLDGAKSALKRSLALKPDKKDEAEVKKLLGMVDSYERSLAPANYVVFTTMPVN